MDFFKNLFSGTGIKILFIVIVLDLIFGILRAIKEKSVNSCIGIDGMIRKFRNGYFNFNIDGY